MPGQKIAVSKVAVVRQINARRAKETAVRTPIVKMVLNVLVSTAGGSFFPCTVAALKEREYRATANVLEKQHQVNIIPL